MIKARSKQRNKKEKRKISKKWRIQNPCTLFLKILEFTCFSGSFLLFLFSETNGFFTFEFESFFLNKHSS